MQKMLLNLEWWGVFPEVASLQNSSTDDASEVVVTKEPVEQLRNCRPYFI